MDWLTSVLVLAFLGFSTSQLFHDGTEENEICQDPLANSSFSCCYYMWIHYLRGEVNDNSKCHFQNLEEGQGDENGCRASKEWEASEESCDDFELGFFAADVEKFEGKEISVTLFQSYTGTFSSYVLHTRDCVQAKHILAL